MVAHLGRPSPAEQICEADRPTKSCRATLRGGRTDQVSPSNFVRWTTSPSPTKQLYKADRPTKSHRAILRGGLSTKSYRATQRVEKRKGHDGLPVHLWAPAPCTLVTRTAGARLYLVDIEARRTLLPHASHGKAHRHHTLSRMIPQHAGGVMKSH